VSRRLSLFEKVPLVLSTFLVFVKKVKIKLTSSRWDPRDDASHAQIDHRAVYSAACRMSAIAVGCIYRTCHTCTSAVGPLPPGAVNTRPPAVAVYVALADGRCAIFWRYLNFPKTQRGTGRRKPVRKTSPRSEQPFRYNTGLRNADRHTDTWRQQYPR